jgi:hypothetical protein
MIWSVAVGLGGSRVSVGAGLGVVVAVGAKVAVGGSGVAVRLAAVCWAFSATGVGLRTTVWTGPAGVQLPEINNNIRKRDRMVGFIVLLSRGVVRSPASKKVNKL